ncbi:MAG: magnesium transporter MgtC [Rubritepida sp.]|nr:magnesium transporter MgtC [Rubritepida sp.]
MMVFAYQALDILLAFVLGSLVGAEREWRRHPGGLRSCAIVAAASSSFMRLMLEVGGNNLSAGLGALATGVGFLGAGVILNLNSVVHGLSTAATFWAVAALGAACGARQFGVAAALFMALVLSNFVLRPISLRIARHAPPDPEGPN